VNPHFVPISAHCAKVHINMKTQWEYTVLKLSTDCGFLSGTDFDADLFHEQLNVQGEAGWKLVSIFDITKVKGGTKFVMAVMKRPKA
jgi:hypothetical protein